MNLRMEFLFACYFILIISQSLQLFKAGSIISILWVKIVKPREVFLSHKASESVQDFKVTSDP